MATTFDVVLLEKKTLEGLTKAEVMDLYDMLSENSAFTLEVENFYGDSIAMGFIAESAAERLYYCYSGLQQYIESILADMAEENELGVYRYDGLDIYLSRTTRKESA